jgi:hypothetical protein
MFACTISPRVPHLSRLLRKVGTTNGRSAVLEVDFVRVKTGDSRLLLTFKDSYQGMPSGIPNPAPTVEERRVSAA